MSHPEDRRGWLVILKVPYSKKECHEISRFARCCLIRINRLFC
jgi:hypothetical protein